MVKMVGGVIACKVSKISDFTRIRPYDYYCDYCGKIFVDRNKPPCEEREKYVVND